MGADDRAEVAFEDGGERHGAVRVRVQQRGRAVRRAVADAAGGADVYL